MYAINPRIVPTKPVSHAVKDVNLEIRNKHGRNINIVTP
jgi:hypothetical protein